MNANELADLLEASNDPDVRRAVAMLRILDGQLAFRIDAVTKYQEKVEEQQAEIEALHNLVKEQDKKIIDLAFRAVYAERSAEIAYDPKKHGAEE